MNLSRRKFLLGVGAAVAAPAIVRVASLMPVRVYGMSTLEVVNRALDYHGVMTGRFTAGDISTILRARDDIFKAMTVDFERVLLQPVLTRTEQLMRQHETKLLLGESNDIQT